MTKGKSTGQDDGQAQATTYADEQAQAQATAYAERIAENTATFYAKQKKAGIQDEKRTYRTLNEKVSFNVKMTENDDNGITYGINKAEMKADQVKEELKKVSLIDADQVTTQAKQEQNPFVQVRALHGTANALKKTAKAYILKATI